MEGMPRGPLVCLFCRESSISDLSIGGQRVCLTCGCRYTVELLEVADVERWNDIAFDRADDVTVERVDGDPPMVVVTQRYVGAGV